jgi:hypothetical protein
MNIATAAREQDSGAPVVAFEDPISVVDSLSIAPRASASSA